MISPLESLQKKVAVITGGNRGLGFEVARVLARRGAHVVLACRDLQRARKAREELEGQVSLVELDLASLASVDACVDELKARYRGIDLLINNAGVMATPRKRTTDGFELQFGVNHLGHFALTMGLLPLIAYRPGARVVTVSSLRHKEGRLDLSDIFSERKYDRWAAYAQSKLANLLFAVELHRRLRARGAWALSVAAHPGWVDTGLHGHLPLARLVSPALAVRPAEGARPILHAALASGVEGGQFFGPWGFLELRGSPGRARWSRAARDPRLARRLWQESETLTGKALVSEASLRSASRSRVCASCSSA